MDSLTTQLELNNLLAFCHFVSEDDGSDNVAHNIIKFYKDGEHMELISRNNVRFIIVPVSDREPRITLIDDVLYLFKIDYVSIDEMYWRYDCKFGNDRTAILLVDQLVYYRLLGSRDYYMMICKATGNYYDDVDFIEEGYDKYKHYFTLEAIFDHDIEVARSSSDSDIELNPGPDTNNVNICYKKLFNEAQMKVSWLNKWSLTWEADGKQASRMYRLILTFPDKYKTFVSQLYHSKKLCEEDCLKQLHEFLHIKPQSGLVLQQGELKAQDEVIENTMLTTTQEKVVVSSVDPIIEERYLSENRFSDPSLVGVAYRLTPITWDTATTLRSWTVPQILFDDVNTQFAPIAKAFQVHSVYRIKGSFIFKPVSNKFNSGILGITWFPLYNTLDPQSKLARANKYSLSQLPTKYINACTANEVEVEFDHFYPVNYVTASSRANMLAKNDIGSLFIYPLNPLSIGETGSKWCDINIFVKFDHLEFIGKLDQRINPQSGIMDNVTNIGKTILRNETGGLSDIAFNVLDEVTKMKSSNKNADFPVDPSAGDFVIPNFMPSLATTTGLKQPINSLGVNPTAMVKHKYPLSDNFSSLCSVRSLFRTVTVSISATPKLISSWSNVPLKPVSEYEVADGTAVGARYLSSLACVSGLFQNYKGRIIYDFLVSMTDKHNIKFMIGTIPVGTTIPDFDETFLRNSKFQELNFTDGNFSASYEAPYFGAKKWTRIPSDIHVNSDCFSASYVPSRTYLFAISRLSYSTGVAPEITMNIFERAGEDFELSVYKPPIMTPINFPNNMSFLSLYSTWNDPAVMFSPSRLAPNNGSQNASASSNGVFLNCWFNNAPSLPRIGLAEYVNKSGTALQIPGTGGSTRAIFYIPVDYTDPSAVLISPVWSNANLAQLQSAMTTYANTPTWGNFNRMYEFLFNANSTSFNYDINISGFRPYWIPPLVQIAKKKPIPKVTIKPESGLQGRMESFQKQENPFNNTDNRGWGEEDFGENFDSILNLLKRGHNDWSVNISRVPALTYPGAALRLKVSPQPVYNSSITRSDPQAFTAGGVLSIIYSAHYGFKGSMHYQLLCPPNLNTLMWVNYFPDAYTKSDVTIFPVPLRNTQYTPNLVPSAPKCYFNLALNSAARVKIPYYSCSEFIQLNNNRSAAQNGDEAMISSLGSLTLGFDNNNINDLPERFKITIIKSVGDDAGLYFFMGFPPMYHFDEFPVQNFKLARDSTQADIELNPGPIFSKFVYNMGDAFGAGLKNNFDANNIGSKLTNGMFTESLPFIEMFKQALSEQSTQFSQLLQDFSISNVLLEFVTQIGHCLISKTWYNCIWAILTIFVKFGLFSFIKIREMCNLLLTFLKGGSLSSQPILDNDILPENTSAEENSALISYVSIFITSMCGLVGISSSSINKGSIAKNFGKDLKDALVCGNALTTFLKSHMELIKDIFLRIKHYILGKTSEGKLLNDIIGNRKLIGNWLKEVDYLTDPKNLTNVSSTPALQVRIRVCHTLGRALQQKMVLNKDKASNLFNSYYKRIGEKYEELASNGFISHIRETPFVIYNWGPSGVGKSEMSTDLIAYLFNELEIVPKGEMVYTLSPTSAFYDGITDQPCIYIDDFMCINQPEPVLKQFDLLFCAATSATFRPPQAHLTDKKKISNPDLIYINGNLEKIVHDSITDLQAFNRRLQCKIHTFVNPIYTQQGKSKATDFDPETLSKFDHLLFKVHLDSYKYNKNLYTEPMTYMEMRKYVLEKMREHRVLAKQSQQRRLMRENMSRYGNMFSDVTYEDLNDESYIQKRVDEFINDVVEFEMSETSFFTNISNEVKTTVTSLYQDIFSKYYLKACDTFCGFTSIFFDKANDIKCENSEEDVIHYTIFKANIRYVADEGYRNYCYDLLDYMEETYDDFRTYFSKCLQIFDNDQYVTYNLGDFIIKSSADSGNMKKLHYCNCRLVDWECRVPSKHCKSVKCVLLESSLKYFDYEPRKICYVKQVLVRFNDLCSRVVERIYKVFRDVYSTNLGKFILCILGIIGIFSTSYLLGYAVFSLLKFFGFVDEDMTYADAFACTGLITCDCKKCKKEFQARLKFYNKLDNEGLEIENHYDNAPGSKKKAELRVNISKLKTNIKAQSQMLTDTVTKMRKNYRYILLGKQEDMDDNKDVRSLVILGLTGNSFVFLKHYLDDIRNAFQLNHKVKLLDKNVLIELVAEDFADSRFYWRQNEQSNSELGIWSAPASVNQLPNITKFFASENLYSKAGRDVYIANCHQTIDRPDIVTHISAFEDKENTVLHNYNHIVQYENFSQNGYCMSLVFSCSLQKPIAVHAFGSESTGKGYGELIFKEHLTETINEEDIIDPPTFDDLEDIDIEPEDYIKNLVLLGKVPQHQQPFSQGITQLIKSPIHGEIVTQNKEPAPLSMYDKRVNKQYDPMAEGVKKHGCPPTSFNQDHLKICAEDTLRLLLQNARPLRMDKNGKPMVGELSIAEAIVGIPELGFKALDLGTSPGYPLLSIREKGDKGKRAFIKAENDINGVYKLKHISSHLRNLLAMDRKMRINRQMVFSPAIDCLKDELLKIEKARRVGGTRVFSISPVQQVIACKRVFGDFLMTYRKNWQRLEHGIGINPESSDWMFLFKTLKKHPNILEGDYSNFGPQAESSVAMAALTNVVKWYKHYGINRDHLNQMETLVQEFVNAPHLCKNFFYNTNSGIISGSFATAEMNSEINKLYIRLAWCSLVSPDMHLFNEHVTLYTYGDDMIACVSDEYIDKFNVETIGMFFASKNINFTNASKSKTWVKSIKLEEATFLKRGFRVDPDVPNQCLANLEKISIEEQLNWVKKKDSDDHWSLTLQSIDSCLRSASMWGKEYYNDLKNKIELSLIKHNKNYILKTFERQIKDIYDTDNGILTSVPLNIT